MLSKRMTTLQRPSREALSACGMDFATMAYVYIFWGRGGGRTERTNRKCFWMRIAGFITISTLLLLRTKWIGSSTRAISQFPFREIFDCVRPMSWMRKDGFKESVGSHMEMKEIFWLLCNWFGEFRIRYCGTRKTCYKTQPITLITFISIT